MSKQNPYESPLADEPMDRGGYRTTPVVTDRMPPGVPYIIGNELAERFSFYGMRAILVIFMMNYLRNAAGELDGMTKPEANVVNHLFIVGVYAFPLLGGIISDVFWGKFRTIMVLSLVYCLGHLSLAIDETRLGLYIGLFLIALGAGGIKPCVSANVGDQFGARNQGLLPRVFGWFYLSINLGAAASTLVTPLLLQDYGPRLAFGVPGVFMLLATVIFWLGRYKFAHVPPRGPAVIKEVLAPGEGRAAIWNLSLIYIFIAMFWCLFDQTSSAWVQQSELMDRTIPLHWIGIGTIDQPFQILPSQIQAANPILILILTPTFTYFVYPWLGRVVNLTPLRKMGIGFFLAVGSFAISALIEHDIESGGKPHVNWQFLSYLVLTAGEVMVSITALEFSYTQAPKNIKSFVMSVYQLIAVAGGNLLVVIVNWLIQDEDGKSRITGTQYYWFFTGAMLLTAIIFPVVAMRYRGKVYIQDSAPK